MARTGRPTVIDAPLTVYTADTLEPLTVVTADKIVSALRVGTPEEGAAASVGITLATLRAWKTEGARILRRMTQQGQNRSDLSHRERRLADFSSKVLLAEGEWEAKSNGLLDRIAEGGLQVVTVTEKVNADGEVTERSQRTETLGPNPGVLMARLKMRFPGRYSERVEVTGAEGEPITIELRARQIADAARAFQTGRPELSQGEQ